MAIITGTSAGEILTGDPGGVAQDDEIYGLEGHDYLRGRLENDKLYGGDDDDQMNGSFGNDEFYGGNGIDRVSLYDLTGTITTGCKVTLLLPGVAQDTGQGMDIIGGDVEHLSGTMFNDRLTGNNDDNWLWGQNIDFATGAYLSNNDRLTGKGGDDLLEVGAGDHVLNGGNGGDTAALRYVDTGIGFEVSLLLQGAAQDTTQGMMDLSAIEHLSGSDFADTFEGDDGNNRLFGNGGGDTLSGGKGKDGLYGDGWIDIDHHGSGFSGPITLHQSNATDLSGFTASGADTLNGGKAKDLLVGGHDADDLTGGGGDDTFLYLETLDSKPAGSEDLINDLTNGDVIDLAAIDADTSTGADDAFVLVAVLSGAAGEVSLRFDIGLGMTVLECENTGDGIVDMAVLIAGNHTAYSNFVF